MGINVFPQSAGIKAQKYNRAGIAQSSAAQNALYTVVNVTSGTGVLNTINFYHAANLDRLSVTFTVDGVATSVVGVDSVSGGGTAVSARDTNQGYYTSVNVNLTFYTSLKIEISNNNASAANIGCFAQYNLV